MIPVGPARDWPSAYASGKAADWMYARRAVANTDPCAHDWSQQPGKDGKIYNVCRKCGLSFAQGGRS